MKYLKHIILSIMILLVVVTCLFNNRLISFAEEQAYNPTSLKDGDILKSGDYFTFDFDVSFDWCTNVPIRLSLEYNDVIYSTGIFHDTGLINDYENYGYKYFPMINDKYFTQEKAATLPYVDGKTVLWRFTGNVNLDGYCNTDARFIGVVYEEPKFELYCDSTEMGKDDKVACQVAVEYNYVPENVEFELSSDKFNISDITTLDGWKRTDEEKYKFDSEDLPENRYDDSRVSVDIIEFFITPKDKEEKIDVEDAVKVTKVAWKDDYAEKELDSDLIEPMKMKEDKKEEEFEIPQTGVESYILLGVLVTIAGISLYRKLEEKGLFKRI